jgi:hypothetical protein
VQIAEYRVESGGWQRFGRFGDLDAYMLGSGSNYGMWSPITCSLASGTATLPRRRLPRFNLVSIQSSSHSSTVASVRIRPLYSRWWAAAPERMQP